MFSALWTGRSRKYAWLLLTLLSVGSATGYHLARHSALDLDRYHMLKLHVWVGYGALALFLPLLYGAVRRHDRSPLSWMILSAPALFYPMMFLQLRPYEAFLLPTLVLWVTAGVVMVRRLSRSASSPFADGGAAALLIVYICLSLVFASGMYLAGPLHTLRTDWFNRVHHAVGLGLPPALALAFALQYPRATDPRWPLRLLAVVAVAFLAPLTALGVSDRTRHAASLRPAMAMGNSGGVDGCGLIGCHTEIQKQWETSIHRISSANVAYRKVLALFESERGSDAGTYCRRCHEPLSQFSIELIRSPLASPSQGITCRACHLMSSVEGLPANGNYTVANETGYVDEADPSDAYLASIRHEFIRSDLTPHRRSYQRDLLRSADSCATCHRVVVPADMNGDAEITIDGVVRSWQDSRYAREGIRCVDCHMQLNSFADPDSLESRFHARPDHRMFGIHPNPDQILPADFGNPLPWPDFVSATEDWINGRLQVSRYEQWFLRYAGEPRYPAFRNYFQDRPLLDLSIEFKSPTPMSHAVVTVRTTNARIGHDFPGGLLGLIDLWLEIEVKDVDGSLLYSEGSIQPGGGHDPTSHRLGADPLDREGRPIRFNRFWAMAGVGYKRAIAPDQTISDEYPLPQPAANAYPLTVRARWWYRRYRPEFAEWVLGPGIPLRVIKLVEAVAQIDSPL